MKKINSTKQGITLVEIVLAMALLSVVLILTSSLLISSNRFAAKASDEFDTQISIRKTIETINQNIRFSTVSFAVLDDHYTGDESDLTDEWNYVGLSQDGTQVLHYTWNEETNGHDKEILITSDEGYKFELEFFQDPNFENQRIINYKFVIKKDGGPSGNDQIITEINTELEAINAIHIVDRGLYSSKNAVALSYRTDETPTAMSQKAAVAMVLDTSGSMATGMDGTNDAVMWDPAKGNLRINGQLQVTGGPAKDKNGNWLDSGYWYYSNNDNTTLTKHTIFFGLFPGPEPTDRPNRGYVVQNQNDRRINILKKQSQLLVDQIKGNLIEGDIRIIPFDSRASYSDGWLDIQTKHSDLKNSIAYLTATGGTNTGDGLRYAYYAFEDVNKDKARRNYLIILVDGVTTFHSINNNGSFYESNGVAPSLGGNGSTQTNQEINYVKLIGEKLQNFPNNITSFVIGFSDKWQGGEYVELKSVNNIADAVGIDSKHFFDISNRNKPVGDNPQFVFWANDEETLQNVFNSISQYIEADFWQVSGPDN